MMYYISKEDRKMRNRTEFLVFCFYIIGLLLVCLTKCAAFIMVTAVSIPFCISGPGKNFIRKGVQ